MKSQDIAQLGFGFDDSPPNATRPKPKVTPRRGRPPVAPMAQSLDASPQLTDQPDRSDPQALGEVMAPPAQPDPAAAAPPHVPAEGGQPADVSPEEAMAATRDRHPDYRVLRRLVPPLSFPGPAVGAVCRVLLLDTETTGLNPARDKVVELALVGFDLDLATGQPVGALDVYDGLEDPGMPMSEEVKALTGISDEMLKGQRLDESRIAAMLETADLVVAHNAGFDRPFVEARLAQFAQLNWACSFADIDWKLQGRSSAKLGALAMELGWFYDAHRAEMDCHALLAVLMPALPHSGQSGLMQLAQSAQHPSYRLQATAAPFDAKDELKARGYRWDGAAKVWHTRLADEAALTLECQWLKSAVYGGRPARVQVETLQARTKYSARPGLLTWHQL